MTLENQFSRRQRNLLTVLQLLDTNGALSAKQLSEMTNLSVVSINKLIDVLSQNNLIDLNFINTRGRRAKIYQINYKNVNLGLIQISQVNSEIIVDYSLTDLSGETLQKATLRKKIDSISEILNFIKEQTQSNKPYKLIVGVSGDEMEDIMQLSDVSILEGINLSKALKISTEVDSIIINDVNAATLGSATQLKQNQNSAVGIYFPKDFGPGVGIVINNQLITGADGLAGEIVYSSINQNSEIQQQITDHLQNIIAFLNPNLVTVYIDELNFSAFQITQIIQTLHRNLPLHQNYRLDFNRNFQQDYLLGLATIGKNDYFEILSSN
ncbi:ROK family transcriptional regulator [Companilactobacillus suantsaicola]|uniref:ROK family transcriptional regulator n=1 Tax=Companilactobacillus suantsaicola TaxID=2487723 RepID=A0A4Z0JJQ8_9LACO|nr:ROK family protein [Companilactobacillus suantsaicola]TGD22008.1 ROK family transcriptional regulator [Companilactobacillus suantsaicola]